VRFYPQLGSSASKIFNLLTLVSDTVPVVMAPLAFSKAHSFSLHGFTQEVAQQQIMCASSNCPDNLQPELATFCQNLR